jgi:signal transduction histidine kinase
MRRDRIALRVLYVLALYVLLQLMWWGYQLIQLNSQIIISQKLELHEHYLQLRSKVWMVVGEGLVFFMLLAFGFRYIQRTVSRELALARKEKNFLLSVTHELKTPIAAIKLFLETLQTRSLTEEKRNELLQQSVQETKRLQSLTENILLAARLDSTKDSLSSDPVDLKELTEREVKRFRQIYSQEILFESAGAVMISGDEQMLSVLVVNLLDNAIKYGMGQAIEVHLSETVNSIELSVRDGGAGIPKGEEKRIFEKFYRVGNEETRSSKGTGLGLFIVRAVANMHRAEVLACNRSGGGAEFKVRFKKR